MVVAKQHAEVDLVGGVQLHWLPPLLTAVVALFEGWSVGQVEERPDLVSATPVACQWVCHLIPFASLAPSLVPIVPRPPYELSDLPLSASLLFQWSFAFDGLQVWGGSEVRHFGFGFGQ